MGMRALAQILLSKGMKVSGSDLNDSEALSGFRRSGADIYIGHAAENISGADGVVISTAISDENPELAEAKRRNIPVFHRSDVLAAIMKWGKGIAVSGAHGKSTTSSMIGWIFEYAGTDPTIVLGGEAGYLRGNAKLGKGKYIIAEADESDASFLKLSPYITVVTNVEDDHLDHYGSIENLRKAFAEFVSHISCSDGVAVLCSDDAGVCDILPHIHKKYITFGLGADAEYHASGKHYENRKMVFDVWHRDTRMGTIRLQVPGEHNIRDALAAVATAMYCGIPFKKAEEAMDLFTGVKRRFETKAYENGIWIVDDYAHHPTEIEATLKAAKEMGTHRVVCAFQPHRYSRTKLLQKEFASAFKDADVVYFTDIYPAGEKPIPGIGGDLIPSIVHGAEPEKEIHYIPDRENMAEEICRNIRPGDLLITMGAGSICRTGEEIIRILENRDKEKIHDN